MYDPLLKYLHLQHPPAFGMASRRLSTLDIQRLLRPHHAPSTVRINLSFPILSADSSGVVRNFFRGPSKVVGHEVDKETLNVMCHRHRLVETQLLHLLVIRPGREGNLDLRVSFSSSQGLTDKESLT